MLTSILFRRTGIDAIVYFDSSELPAGWKVAVTGTKEEVDGVFATVTRRSTSGNWKYPALADIRQQVVDELCAPMHRRGGDVCDRRVYPRPVRQALDESGCSFRQRWPTNQLRNTGAHQTPVPAAAHLG